MKGRFKAPKNLVDEIRLTLGSQQMSLNELSRRIAEDSEWEITAPAVRQKLGRVMQDPDTIKLAFALEICKVLKLRMWVG